MKIALITAIVEAIVKLSTLFKKRSSAKSPSSAGPARKTSSSKKREDGMAISSILWLLLFFMLMVYLWVPSEYFTAFLWNAVANRSR